MSSHIDQLGDTITLNSPAKRIVSLVPSQTELLFDLGLDDEVVGITKYCIYPDHQFQTKPKIGGTKNLDHQAIEALKPDLILGNKEENVKDDIKQLKTKYPVWMSDIDTLAEAIQMIDSVGQMTGREDKAQQWIDQIHQGFASLQTETKKTVAYLIWKKPMMVTGSATFIHDMIEKGGWTNVFADSTRYPEVSAQDIQNKNPDLIFLSTEPYPFKQKDVEEFQQDFPNSQVVLVDGTLFSWYGSRLTQSASYFKSLQSQIS